MQVNSLNSSIEMTRGSCSLFFKNLNAQLRHNSRFKIGNLNYKIIKLRLEIRSYIFILQLIIEKFK